MIRPGLKFNQDIPDQVNPHSPWPVSCQFCLNFTGKCYHKILRMKFSLLAVWMMVCIQGWAQGASVKIALSRDTVLLGNAFYLVYTFELKDANFKAPAIQGGLVLGQSLMNNTSFVDGQLKAVSSQRYLIQPSHSGPFVIPATTIESSSGDIDVPSIEVYVKENPSHLEEDPEEDKEWKTRDILTIKNHTPSRKTKKL